MANKAAFLMTDGGAFNGKTVVGLGIPKVAKIWYEVQTHLFTSASDYQNLYDCLQQACADLVGTAGITTADCRQVKNALDAAETGQQPELCAVGEATVCTTGQSPVSLFFDDLESGSDHWTSNAAIGDDLWYRAHEYATSGRYSLWGDDPSTRNDHAVTMLNDISLPAGSNAYLHCRHAYDPEASDASLYDGAVVEYGTDGGCTWRDAGAFFTENSDNGSVSGAYDNPLAGRRAFGGQSYGYVSSRLDLGSLAGQRALSLPRWVGHIGRRPWLVHRRRAYLHLLQRYTQQPGRDQRAGPGHARLGRVLQPRRLRDQRERLASAGLPRRGHPGRNIRLPDLNPVIRGLRRAARR